MLFQRVLPLLLIPAFAFAQEDAHKLKIDARKAIRIDYLAPSWNKDSDKVETSALLLRDAISGRIVKVEVTESGPNTATFIGVYQISFSNNQTEITPEIYVAPPAMIRNDPQMKHIAELIKNGALLRKPYFLRTEQGAQTLSVFDSRDQAVQAFEYFQKSGQVRPLVSPAALDAEKTAQKLAEEKKRLQVEHEAEMARARILEEEKLKQEELKRQQAAMSEAEREKRHKQAQAIAKQAMIDYNAENFKGAEEKFNQAVDLDPNNSAYNFQYGVSLFKNEKYNNAIVVLKLATGEGVNTTERDYYIALAYMRIKEFEKAREIFKGLMALNDKAISPPAAFFAGVIDFQKESLDPAKADFEYVLDNSTDPKMDQQAESYIEQIANIKRFEEMRKKKIIVSLNLGLMYDSNILSVEQPNDPTNLAGFRWAYGGSVEYRPVFSEKHEFSGILSISDMYSTDKSLKADAAFQNNDPQVFNFSLPYKYKGQFFGKAGQLGLTPAYEFIKMNADQVGERETIIQSNIVKMDGTFVVSEDYFANYALEVRHDKSLISQPGDDDQNANKASLTTSHTLFRDKKKTTAWILDGALADNMAAGNNQKYNRLDLAGSYLMPAFGSANLISRLDLGYAAYPSHIIGRTDNNYGLSFTLQKQISEMFGLNFMASYTKNKSTLENSSYDKYMIMTGMNWKNAF